MLIHFGDIRNMGKEVHFQNRHTASVKHNSQTTITEVTNYVVLGKVVKISLPQFPHM